MPLIYLQALSMTRKILTRGGDLCSPVARQARCNSISNKTRSLPRRCNPPSVYDEINIACCRRRLGNRDDRRLLAKRVLLRCGVRASIFHAALMQRVKPSGRRFFFASKWYTASLALIIYFLYAYISSVDFTKYRPSSAKNRQTRKQFFNH